ncbi:glucose-6-phosphate dehydrogenase [Arhodomonas sp. AD133]|uniref:glucose-6-phosphate dehydrogenase n=1 Tax=Arhodomonas sp. AD133 TaxID=3415009 RepID=UPI003EB6E3D4
MEEISPFEIVIFGGSGDLAMRKLLPALYRRHRAGQLPDDGRIVGTARSAMDRERYIAEVEKSCRRYLPADEFDSEVWASFAERLDFARVDATDADSYTNLSDCLGEPGHRSRVFYLATSPKLFVDICRYLQHAGLTNRASRVVLEKPLGHDLASAQTISEQIGEIFAEDQIYRIDHYLGKETVQNLIALRFGNALFEPLWRREWVRDVQITVAEQVGVEGRAGFYDNTGALRDMVQNHLLQLLAITAMEPPTSIDQNAVRDEKLKVLRALLPLRGRDAIHNTVRGQYRAGAVDGQPVPGYLEEDDVVPESRTETFAALKAELGTWRWSGVPFYLRTGKRLQERLAEIVINFRQVPHSIFDGVYGASQPNRLVIRLQPDEGMKLYIMAKAPGDEMRLRPVSLDLDFAETFKQRQADAYERLLTDVLRGRLTLFMRRDELYAAWEWVEPILEAWENIGDAPKSYTAGTWGPAASSALLSRDGAAWHEES